MFERQMGRARTFGEAEQLQQTKSPVIPTLHIVLQPHRGQGKAGAGLRAAPARGVNTLSVVVAEVCYTATAETHSNRERQELPQLKTIFVGH